MANLLTRQQQQLDRLVVDIRFFHHYDRLLFSLTFCNFYLIRRNSALMKLFRPDERPLALIMRAPMASAASMGKDRAPFQAYDYQRRQKLAVNPANTASNGMARALLQAEHYTSGMLAEPQA